MKAKIFNFTWYLTLAFSAFAGVPAGYYNQLVGKKGAVLKTAVHDIICQDTTHYLKYGSGAGYTWEGFYSTDRDEATNQVLDLYSDTLRFFPKDYVNQNYPGFGSTIQIEHSVPKSWWGCDITHPDCAARDLNHLFPADGRANNYKSDHALGIVTGTPTFNNGLSKLGPGINYGYSGTVFEPGDKYKGDFARNYFYIATAYQHYMNKWDKTNPENMMEANTYPTLKPWALQMLLDWNNRDKISSKELNRNDKVFAIQMNRNPFVDYPELAEYIWGNRKTIPFRLDLSTAFPYLKWPDDNDTIDLKTSFFHQPKDTVINLSAMNLTGDLSLMLGGANAASFSLDKTTVTRAEAEAGYPVKLRYYGKNAGNQSADLTVSGGGISPVSLRLKTYTLNDFVALPATNLNTGGFTAKWTASADASGYLLDVFTYQNIGNVNNSTILEEDFFLPLPNKWTKSGYNEGTVSGVRLGSGSDGGTLTTPTIDLSTGTATLTVRAKQYSNDNGAGLTATVDGNPLVTWTTAVVNQDFTVEIPVSTPVSKITFSVVAGKRVIIDYVKIVLHTPRLDHVSVTGYPKSVGNVLSFNVTGLQKATNYYYSITPEGNGAVTSNVVAVQTVATKLSNPQRRSKVAWIKHTDGIQIYNLNPDCTVNTFDINGKHVQSMHHLNDRQSITFPERGLYFLKIENNDSSEVLKVNY